jgi:hypothetical protein
MFRKDTDADRLRILRVASFTEHKDVMCTPWTVMYRSFYADKEIKI